MKANGLHANPDASLRESGAHKRLVLFTHGLKYEEGIAAAVISRAVLDAARGTPALRRDAELFFRGSWYVDLCDFLDVPAVRPPVLGG